MKPDKGTIHGVSQARWYNPATGETSDLAAPATMEFPELSDSPQVGENAVSYSCEITRTVVLSRWQTFWWLLFLAIFFGNVRFQKKEKEVEMPITIDPQDPRLGHGVDSTPRPQNEVYLVLSEEERAKGFVRPVRHSYRHVGSPAPKYPLRDLTTQEKARFGEISFAKFEKYPDSSITRGRYWTQSELDNALKGCGTVTTIGQAIAETYACQPGFYGSTRCEYCGKHLPVSEFVWVDDDTLVGS